ncbi:MAG: FG-GAP-like repeat-containing protein [Phycisphaerae bacterium]
MIARMCIALAPLWIVGCSGDDKESAPVTDASSASNETRKATEIPFPDTTEMEPRVVSVLEDARNRVVTNPMDAMAWGNLGVAFDAHFLFDEAATAYRRASELSPDTFDWVYHLGHVEMARGGDLGEVNECFKRAARLEENYAPLYWQLGANLMASDKFAEAAGMFSKALAIDPDAAVVKRDLGRCLLKGKDPRRAIAPLAQALETLPGDATLLSALIEAYESVKDTQSVSVLKERLADAAPGTGMPDPLRERIRTVGVSSTISSERAGALLQQGRYQEATRDFHVAAMERPKDAGLQLGLGKSYLYAGDLDKAQFHLQNALRLDPELVAAHMEMGQIMMARREALSAGSYFRQALRLAPEEGLAYAQLGAAMLAASNFRESILALSTAEKFMELSGEMECNLAAALALDNQPDESLARYESAIEKQPRYAQAHFGIGYVLQNQGQYAEAIPHLIAALQINPKHVDAMTYLGLCHQRVGRLTDALSIYREALRLEPNLPLAPNMDALQKSVERRRAAGVIQPPFDRAPEFALMAKRLFRYEPKYLGQAYADQLKRELEEGSPVTHERINLQVELAQSLIQIGDEDGAVSAIESAFSLANATSGYEPSPAMHRLRALVYVRKAEVQNCINHHNADSCILPLENGGVHVDPAPSRIASESYTRYLEKFPDDLGAKWLLNVTFMMRGEYPDKVPADMVIPQGAHATKSDFPRFRDIAPALGIAPFDLCGGVVIDDMNGDGRLDIVTSTFDPSGPLACFRREADGTFSDQSEPSRLSQQCGGLNVVGADYDNDGDTDLLILRGAWMYDAGKLRNSLLQNDGNGVFTDVSFESGIALPAYPTQTATWADFDNDGDLDLYIGNESRAELEPNTPGFPSQLFVNQGDGTFIDYADAAGVTNDRYCKGVAAGDYDNDGDMDIYVSNNGANRLYRNNGNLMFTDVSQDAGVWEPAGRSFATWFFDYDNDGWLDLFVGAYDGTIADLAADYLDKPFAANKPRLYRNNGDGTFSDQAESAGLHHVYMPMGASFGDLDYDGYQDIYLSTGDPSFETLVPNVMLRNIEGKRFEDVTIKGGFGHAQKGHGVAFADLDQDGDQDIYNQLGGFYPGDRFSNVLYENPGLGGKFVVVELAGTTSNRSAYGARVSVTLESDAGDRVVHRAVGSVSSFGGTPRRLEIGLGNANRIKAIQVTWPVTGKTQRVEDLACNQMVRITEGKSEWEASPLQPLPFPALDTNGHDHHHHGHHHGQ